MLCIDIIFVQLSFAGGTSLDTAISSKSETSDVKSLERILEIPWFLSMTNNNISLRRKEVSRDRKQKWIFKSTQTHRGTGVKEYNTLIGLGIEKSRKTQDEEGSLQQIYKA